MAKNVLGRGLEALIQKQQNNNHKQSVVEIAITNVFPSKLQPRKFFKDEQIQELAQSIEEHGIIQPLIVRQQPDGYELIAGERRWRAAQLVKLDKLPALIQQVSDKEVLEMALVENLQRADLNAIEEGRGYLQLMQEFELKQAEIAKRVGKSRTTVANTIRLLDLEPRVQNMLAQEQISVGHAKVILGIKDTARQYQIATYVIEQKATVRQTERLVKQELNKQLQQQKKSKVKANNPHVAGIVAKLTAEFQTKVKIIEKADSSQGKIQINYQSELEFKRILELLGIDVTQL